jgi:DNA-binding FadR family transcriptional regulator
MALVDHRGVYCAMPHEKLGTGLVKTNIEPAISARNRATSVRLGAGRSKVREALVSALVEAIVSGEMPENATLPNETELITRYKVSRTALREAMQFLSAQGMVRARTRAGTVVLPGEEWNFLDPMVLDAALRHRANTSFYEALLEARALLEPEAASLAAARATARQVALIEEAFFAMVESNSRDDEAWSRADLAFHTAIIEASGNWIYRHFASVIRAALLVTFRLTHRHTTSHGDVVAMHRDVLEAIRLRKPEEASAAMDVLIKLARKELAVVLEHAASDRPLPMLRGLESALPRRRHIR